MSNIHAFHYSHLHTIPIKTIRITGNELDPAVDSCTCKRTCSVIRLTIISQQIISIYGIHAIVI